MILRAFQARPNSLPALCRREYPLELRWGLCHAKKSEAWLSYRDRPVARPVEIDDYLSRGGKPAFCRAAAICSPDSDVSTSTRRVASTARAKQEYIACGKYSPYSK